MSRSAKPMEGQEVDANYWEWNAADNEVKQPDAPIDDDYPPSAQGYAAPPKYDYGPPTYDYGSGTAQDASVPPEEPDNWRYG